MKDARPIENPIPAATCWFEVYNPYEHLEAAPPKATPVALKPDEAREKARRQRNEKRNEERESARRSPYLQVKLKANKALQKKLKAIFDE